MCEGPRVKMGYVTYGESGKKNSKRRVGLKKQRGIYRRRKTGGEEKKYTREGIPRERERGREHVCMCVYCALQYGYVCFSEMESVCHVRDTLI
jgi:hypothetical protein